MRKSIVLAGLMLAALTGCDNDASVAKRNLSTDADNFKIPRRIAVINGVTDKYLLEVQGFCSFSRSGENAAVMNIICKVDGGFKKHDFVLSHNVTMVSEQLSGRDVSTSFYKFTFKPSTLIPDVELR